MSLHDSEHLGRPGAQTSILQEASDRFLAAESAGPHQGQKGRRAAIGDDSSLNHVHLRVLCDGHVDPQPERLQ